MNLDNISNLISPNTSHEYLAPFNALALYRQILFSHRGIIASVCRPCENTSACAMGSQIKASTSS